jgi:hypothetical protein
MKSVAATALVAVCAVVLAEQRVGRPERAESAAIGLIRAIVSAESAYATMYGYYDTLECLATLTCTPGVRAGGSLLDRELAVTRTRGGYRFELHAGPPRRFDTTVSGSPTAMTQFAVVAVPERPDRTRRAFCADDRGVIYVTRAGDDPEVAEGRCVDTNQTVGSPSFAPR